MSARPLYQVDPAEPEWVVLWEALETDKGDTRAEDPESGEVWQYMGTVTGTCGFVHQFRHQCHPDYGRKIVANVQASRTWQPAQGPAANGPV